MTMILSTTCTDKYPGASQQFHASRSWLYRFLKRHHLSLRRRTKISQKLPEDLTSKLIEFYKFVIRSRSNYQYDLSQIVNMDKTPVYFDMAGAYTINQKGAKTVQI
ncbi:42874_t:CDS:1, partial [Gigaspora margarita]